MAKKLLYEVSIIRPIIIFLLVVLHCFAIYENTWWGGVEALGIQDVKAYGIFWKFISGFRIEMIALVAGYVFSFQVNDLHRVYEFKSFAWKKFKRLLIPCWFFSIAYFFIFMFSPDMGIKDSVITILTGAGHLWFLPMLFCCFICLWCIWKFKFSSVPLFLALMLFSIAPGLPIGYGLSKLPHFLFYCYMGYCMWSHNVWLEEKCTKNWIILSLLAIYCALFICDRYYISGWDIEGGLIMRGLNYGIHSLTKFFISVTGIFCMYLFVLKLVRKKHYVPSSFVVGASSLCYGMYVYHQFILRGLYIYTDLPTLLGSYLLPWVALLITVGASYVLTKITLKFKFGRFLIG